MLSAFKVVATIPVTDLDRARAYYVDTLGLQQIDANPNAVRFSCGGGSELSIFKRGPSKADHTLAHFREWMFMSPLFRSQAYVTWQKQGSATTATLATAEWKKLLESYDDPGIDPAVDEELQEYMQRRRVEIEAAL